MSFYCLSCCMWCKSCKPLAQEDHHQRFPPRVAFVPCSVPIRCDAAVGGGDGLGEPVPQKQRYFHLIFHAVHGCALVMVCFQAATTPLHAPLSIITQQRMEKIDIFLSSSVSTKRGEGWHAGWTNRRRNFLCFHVYTHVQWQRGWMAGTHTTHPALLVPHGSGISVTKQTLGKDMRRGRGWLPICVMNFPPAVGTAVSSSVLHTYSLHTHVHSNDNNNGLPKPIPTSQGW